MSLVLGSPMDSVSLVSRIIVAAADDAQHLRCMNALKQVARLLIYRPIATSLACFIGIKSNSGSC